MVNLLVLSLFIVFFVADIATNLQDGVPTAHIWHEALLCSVAMISLAWQIHIIFRKNRHLKLLGNELLETKKSWQEWKDKTHSSALQLRQQIDYQFSLWQLSHSEKDVALLLIKGLSMKEIAEIRETQEKTVRQQSTVIYRKAGLSGRQELAAFFLEDILSIPVSLE